MSRPGKRIRTAEISMSSSGTATEEQTAGMGASASSPSGSPAAAAAASTTRPRSRAEDLLPPDQWADVLTCLPFEDIKQCTAVDHYFLREVSPHISYDEDFVLRISVTPFLAMLYTPMKTAVHRNEPDFEYWECVEGASADYTRCANICEHTKAIDSDEMLPMNHLMIAQSKAQATAAGLPNRFQRLEKVNIMLKPPYCLGVKASVLK